MKNTKTTKNGSKQKSIQEKFLSPIKRLERQRELIDKKINTLQNKYYVAYNELYRDQFVGKWLKVNGLYDCDTDTKKPTFETFRIVKCSGLCAYLDSLAFNYDKLISIEEDREEQSIDLRFEQSGMMRVYEDVCVKVIPESEVIELLNKIDMKASNFIGECMQLAKPDIVEQARKERSKK